ncbi:SAVMC3_10250 family protein [Kribbella sp. NBC_01505]|uniref:SAVMC3_10250 family protein n=1 Tax=Kribbella sp. NBC_01505 TaxID=2903580 RepID=UPI003869CFF7
MRELVYLSQAKLQQFRKPANKRDGLSGGLKVTTGTGLPSAEVGLTYDAAQAAVATTATLDEAEKFIRAKWPVRYWTEELEPGEWIQFEARLAYGVLETDSPGRRQLLLFRGRDDPQDAASPQLVLHGSPQHLLPAYADAAPTELVSMSRVSALINFLQATDDGENAESSPSLQSMLPRVIRQLRLIAPDLTAGWLSGMARTSFEVSANGRRIVVASPLFVEHIPAPK